MPMKICASGFCRGSLLTTPIDILQALQVIAVLAVIQILGAHINLCHEHLHLIADSALHDVEICGGSGAGILSGLC